MTNPASRHPALAEALRWLAWEHMPPALQEISRPLSELGHHLADTLYKDPQDSGTSAEPSVQLLLGIQRLVEAKDALVRAAVQAGEATTPAPPDEVPGIPAQV